MASLSSVKPVPTEELQALQPGTAIIPQAPQQSGGGEAGGAVGGGGADGARRPDAEVDFTDPTTIYDFILYYHESSEPALAALREVRARPALSQKVWLQDVADIPPEDMLANQWCDGVPILVNRRSGEAFRGLRAFQYALATSPALRAPPAAASGGSLANPAFGLVRNQDRQGQSQMNPHLQRVGA